MTKQKGCCSINYEHDRNYYNLLEACNKNENIGFFTNHRVYWLRNQRICV